MQPGVSVVLPCLNEEETLGRCLDEIHATLSGQGVPYEIIVADNGSQDRSREIALSKQARVVDVKRRGYGSALHGGILSANFEVVCFGDSDLSYPMTMIPRLIEPILKGEADLSLGSRLKGWIQPGAMPRLNRLVGTPALSWLIRRLFGVPVSDCNSGMRAVRKTAYRGLSLSCPGMEYASEMLVKASRAGIRYTERPIEFRGDQRSRPPHLRRWRDGWRHLRFILGNAPSTALIFVPGSLGMSMLGFSVVLTVLAPRLFHTSLALIALSCPLLILTCAMAILKAALVQFDHASSRLIHTLNGWAENTAPFYVAVLIYFLAFAQLLWVFSIWARSGFGELSAIAPMIRVTALSILATVILALDIGLGLIKLIPQPEPISPL